MEKKLEIKVKLISLFVLTALISGCGPGYYFKKAKSLEEKKFYPQAAAQYLKVADKYSECSVAPEALYNAGRIYQKELKIYTKAIEVFSGILKNYSGKEPWGALAKQGIFDSPGYFPLEEGNLWVEGDSDTGGNNMRNEISCSKVKEGIYKITEKYFAGPRIVTSVVRYFKKIDYNLLESADENFDKPLIKLKYPFEKNSSWETSSGARKFRMTIIDDNVTVKVRAGEFKGCIKVRQEDSGLPGSYKFEYFAPETGKILTTVGSQKSGSEHRNTELISFSLK